jgi:hypothetical protein
MTSYVAIVGKESPISSCLPLIETYSMPTLLPVPRFETYESLLYKKDIPVQELIHILSKNEKSIISYLTSLNNQFQDSVQSVNSITTVISNLLLTAQSTGFTISGGTIPRTLVVDLNLIASTGLFIRGTPSRIDSTGSTTLSTGGEVSHVDISPVYGGQESITIVGDIHRGTWSGGDVTFPLGNTTQRVHSLGRLVTTTSPTGIGNSTGTADTVLILYTLPLDSLKADGQSLILQASGHFASNGNNKRVKVNVLGTVLLDSNILTLNNQDWSCILTLIRTDATHLCCTSTFFSQNTVVVLNTPSFLVSSLTQTSLPLTLIGSSPTTGAANDVLVYTETIDYVT